MVIAGRVNRIGFYGRTNQREWEYARYLDEALRRLKKIYGVQKWKLEVFFDKASGIDPDRKEFSRLKLSVQEGKIDVVVTVRAEMLSRDVEQFAEFKQICESAQVDIICLSEEENGGRLPKASLYSELIRRVAEQVNQDEEKNEENSLYIRK